MTSVFYIADMVPGLLAQLPGTPPANAADGIAYVGSVGDLVSAALQTAGLYAQSDILSKAAEPLLHAGAYLYAFALLGCLFSISLFGDYKVARYLLVGPTLFAFMVGSTVPGKMTMYRVGQRQVGDIGQRNIFEIFDEGGVYEDTARVSWFYAKFDAIVSEAVQNTVSVLLDTKLKTDLVTVATESALNRIFSYHGSDPAFLEFLSKGLMGRCSTVTSGYIELSGERFRAGRDGTRPNQAEFTARRAEIDTFARNKNIRLTGTEVSYLTAAVGGSSVTGLDVGNPVVSCDDIWNFIIQIVQHKATNIVANETSRSPTDIDTDIPWADVRDKLNTIVRGNNTHNVANVVAAYYLRNTLRDTTHSALTTQLFSRLPMQANRYNGIYGTFMDSTNRSGFLQIVYFAGTVVYVQGLLLYLLTAAFPFFCLYLVSPGGVPSFMIWAGLWVWVKSWDIGFAAIYAIRAFMLNFAGRGINARTIDLNTMDPLSVFQVVYQNDPVATFNTHYIIIGTLYLIVPLVTAHFCLGATNLFDAFKTAINMNAQRFSSRLYDQSRRRFAASPQEMGNGLADSRAGFAAALGALRRDGERKNGGSGRSGLAGLLDRNLGNRQRMGDANVAREMHRAYKQGINENQFSTDQLERGGALAAFTNRRTLYTVNNDRGRGSLDAYLDRQTENNIGRDGESGHYWWDGSAKGTFGGPDVNNQPITNGRDGDD